jgi:hypothetical protein
VNDALKPIDPASHPALSGVMAPVDEELSAANLPVTGRIPDDLRGVYLRNGPNPKFTPLGSYTYPLDGDGMIHGVWLEDGNARYRNRYVLTKGLAAEIRAGRALWGGIMTPAVPAPALAGSDTDPGGDKVLPDINIVRHAHKFLALGEGVAPYQVTPDLATVGSYAQPGDLRSRPRGAWEKPARLGAGTRHARRDHPAARQFARHSLGPYRRLLVLALRQCLAGGRRDRHLLSLVEPPDHFRSTGEGLCHPRAH